METQIDVATKCGQWLALLLRITQLRGEDSSRPILAVLIPMFLALVQSQKAFEVSFSHSRMTAEKMVQSA